MIVIAVLDLSSGLKMITCFIIRVESDHVFYQPVEKDHGLQLGHSVIEIEHQLTYKHRG